MGKAVITLTDGDGDVGVQVDFDPVYDSKNPSDAQTTAIQMVQSVAVEEELNKATLTFTDGHTEKLR